MIIMNTSFGNLKVLRDFQGLCHIHFKHIAFLEKLLYNYQITVDPNIKHNRPTIHYTMSSDGPCDHITLARAPRASHYLIVSSTDGSTAVSYHFK